MHHPRLGLGARLAVAMVGSLTLLLASLGFVYIRFFRHSQEQLIMDSEDRLGEVIRRSTRAAMLRNDRDELAATLREIGRQKNLERLRIYDKSGTIRYSSLPSEEGQRVDLTADACDRCHASAQPLRRLERPDRTRVYRHDGHRVMGMIQPVPNEADCSAAPCHVHPPEREVLGVLDVQMSLDSIDRTVQGRVRSFILTSLLALVVISCLTLFVTWRTVHRPVHNLIRATRAISAGRLDERVPDRFDSDLSELVRSFNQMTADLQSAKRESEEWARTLEDRVEEKSAALRRAQDEMIQVEKMASLGKLSAIVAHEINNPLAGIRTYAKLLLKKLRPSGNGAGGREDPVAVLDNAADAREWLTRIENEAGRCGEIVRNLLSFARGSRPEIAPLDLNEVVSQSVRLVQHQLDLSSIRVRTSFSSIPPVPCDSQQIKQALLAMLINACEAMPQGGVLSVGTSALEGGRSVEISVQDTGVGMDAETRKHIFEPFFTTKDGTATGGTGLGLAVVFGIVQGHGGSVTVDSCPGRGSTFHIILPCALNGAGEKGEKGEIA